jgi:hypothetical protein
MNDRDWLLWILSIWPLLVVSPLFKGTALTEADISFMLSTGVSVPLGCVFCLCLNWIGSRIDSRTTKRE